MLEKKSVPLDFNRVMPIFVLVLVDVLGLTVILPLLHLYAAAYGASPLEIGLVAAAFPLAQLIGVPMMGALSDRLGRKPLLLISQITTCISFIMLGFANSLVLIIASRVLDGLFGANFATAQAALTDISTEDQRSQALGLTGAAFGLGFIFGPVLALIALEMTGSLATPAFTAAVYSFISILLTLFFFKETLPAEQRGQKQGFNPFAALKFLAMPKLNVLLFIIFAQQVIFFGFETLLGLFILNRTGLLGQGSTLIFLIVGITLVLVQGRFIGKWTQKYGEIKVIYVALALLGISLVLMSQTPQQAHPFYVKAITEYDLREQAVSSTEAVLGDLQVSLPENANRGIGALIWIMVIVIPLSVGAGLIRPSLNSLLTKRVTKTEFGAVLGLSSSFVSAANAIAPLLGGYLFQHYGAQSPFFYGGLVMLAVFGASLFLIRETKINYNKANKQGQ